MSNLRLVNATTGANPNAHDLYLDESGQLVWIGMDQNNTEDYSRMILQRIKCRLLFIRGEWYLDQRLGTPWREKIWVKGTDLEVIRQIMKTVVEGTPGVESIDSFEVVADTASRTLTVTLTATTDLQTVISTEELDEPFIVEMPYG